MPTPGSKPLDIEKLAEGAAEIEFTVSLADLPRLRSQFPGIEGVVRGQVRFSREARFIVADLTLSGIANLECQRCLRPMAEPVSSTARIALIGTEAEASGVPDDLEPVLAAEGRVRIADLVEEEMLLELPIVPLHRQPGECAVASDAAADAPPVETTQKPFEQLAKLLGR